ncbi:hypothetical protein Barb7_01685 [Bacteroidales bacterium Barb7]|nr:hypothetical protein Barb7_01685 [Bacteroidales bacterium Barb7]
MTGKVAVPVGKAQSDTQLQGVGEFLPFGDVAFIDYIARDATFCGIQQRQGLG